MQYIISTKLPVIKTPVYVGDITENDAHHNYIVFTHAGVIWQLGKVCWNKEWAFNQTFDTRLKYSHHMTPCWVSDNVQDCISKAIECSYDVLMFETTDEFLAWVKKVASE